MHDPNLDTVVAADTFAYGLGTVMRQEQTNGNLRLVAYISRTLNSTEVKYAQIKKRYLPLGYVSDFKNIYLYLEAFLAENQSQASCSIIVIKKLG